MKKAILCAVLLCLILIGCAAVTNQPTTGQRMDGTTTAPANPTTLSTTMRAPTTNQGYPSCLNSRHVYEDGICKYCKKPANIVRIVSGERSIAPVGGILVKKTYDNGQWPTAIHPPFQFGSYVDSQIPSIQLAGSVQLQMAENVELKGAWMQRYQIGEQTAITLQQLPELAPGTYYIGIALEQKDHFVADDWETTTYQFGFKLIVPDVVIPPTAPTTKPTTKPTTQPTTKPTTWPTEKRDPCPYGHFFDDGVCMYCDSPDPCAEGHAYKNSVCIHCGLAEACADGHNFDGGNCSGCGLPVACYHNMHSYQNGACKYCKDKEPLDEDARLMVNGKDITAGNYVKINKGYRSAYIPLTAVLTELDIPWEWESDTVLRIKSGAYERQLDLTLPGFGWLAPPGTLGGMREIVDGEIIMEDNTLWWELFRPLNISYDVDYYTNTVRIER